MKRNSLKLMVGVVRFERTALCSQSKQPTFFTSILLCIYGSFIAPVAVFCTRFLSNLQPKAATTILLLLILACPAHADEWTQADTAREVTYLVLHVVDMSQTIYIAEHPDQYCERNRLMFSEHPSKEEVYWKFAVGAVLHPVVSYGLRKYAPDGWVQAFQYITIGIEIGAVANNASIGIGFGF